MATVRDIVKGAYNRLNLLPLGSDLDPDRAAQGLEGFTDLANSLVAYGIFPGGPNAPMAKYMDTGQNQFQPHGPNNAITPPDDDPQDYSLDDAFPLPSQFIRGFKALLAVELADAGGMVPSPVTAKLAGECMSSMLAYYVTAPTAYLDPALLHMPSQRERRTGDFINDSSIVDGSVDADGDEIILTG